MSEEPAVRDESTVSDDGTVDADDTTPTAADSSPAESAGSDGAAGPNPAVQDSDDAVQDTDDAVQDSQDPDDAVQDSDDEGRIPTIRTWLPVLVIAGVAALLAYCGVSGATRYDETGDNFPGLFTSMVATAGYFLGALTATATLGALAYVVLCARPDDHNVIDPQVYRAHRIAERAGATWAVVALLMTWVSAANAAGVPLSKATDPNVWWPLIDASEQSLGWLVSACCAAVVAVCARMLLRWTSHVVLLIPACAGVLALAVTGNAGQGPNHDYGTSAVIVFSVALTALVGLLAATGLTQPTDTSDHDLRQSSRRVFATATGLGVLTLVFGAVLGALLIPARYAFTTAYGRWGVVAAIALAVATAAPAIGLTRATSRRMITVVTTVGAGAGIAALAAIAAMETRFSPALLAHKFTIWDVFLGYHLDSPPSVSTLLGTWRFDLFLGLGAIVLAVAYVVGVLRLRRDGVNWSGWRTLSWLLGCAALLFVTSSGVRAYGMAMFSVHMAEHMVLNMFVPVLLILGAPVTLGLRAFPTAERGALPGPREWIVWMVHSRFVAVISNPLVALAIFVGSLYAVYFTPLFDVLDRYHWGHELMSVHFLITGYLFYWAIIGLDPGPKRLPYFARLGLLLAVMPFHAFFGIATMTMQSVIGHTFYTYVGLPWVTDQRHDQFVGGAIAWGASEVPLLIVVLALAVQWARSDRSEANSSDRRVDKYADDELDAYNAMLDELSKSRR
ncbi:cytochrome c oxidase assembly protein [Gordonia jinhuaensis]|uniref:Copper resistance protein D n=1 Tax=Gordonia jinhuaensis TaxID=1517702 RepID=A0A916TAE9_9ACTN|nr:cytochrome c oxidase assembly protein [Gordonia jinhuaensis]GGB35111.1 hypothetical protein GCM10011489_23930 [Gordonia jinhuaensis]